MISFPIPAKRSKQATGEPRPAPMRSFRVVNSSSLQATEVSGAVAHLVSR
jgi:hypothetical protein